MGFYRSRRNGDLTSSAPLTGSSSKSPEDSYNLVYIVHFILGAGYLLPWNAFITAVDYFDYLYPNTSVDRIFSVVYMVMTMFVLVIILPISHKSTAFIRINTGLLLFLLSLLVVPIVDLVHTKLGFYLTVSAVGLSGVSDALVQGSIIGSAGELPERYMQATILGTAASGFLVSVLRILTKAVYPPDPHGLRKSANLYFAVSIVFMAVCIVCYNAAHNLPVIKYYRDLKMWAVSDESDLHGFSLSKTLRDVVRKVKWYGVGLFLIYVVTLSIFPGYITEDVHSVLLGDWYSIILITGYNMFDLVGKWLTAVYIPENSCIAVVASAARFLFYPLFFGCLHGPEFLHSEIPVTLLTCLLGLTNGYLTSVLMIMAPKVVGLQHSEVAGIVMVLFLVFGLAVGSIVAWFWVI